MTCLSDNFRDQFQGRHSFKCNPAHFSPSVHSTNLLPSGVKDSSFTTFGGRANFLQFKGIKKKKVLNND